MAITWRNVEGPALNANDYANAINSFNKSAAAFSDTGKSMQDMFTRMQEQRSKGATAEAIAQLYGANDIEGLRNTSPELMQRLVEGGGDPTKFLEAKTGLEKHFSNLATEQSNRDLNTSHMNLNVKRGTNLDADTNARNIEAEGFKIRNQVYGYERDNWHKKFDADMKVLEAKLQEHKAAAGAHGASSAASLAQRDRYLFELGNLRENKKKLDNFTAEGEGILRNSLMTARQEWIRKNPNADAYSPEAQKAIAGLADSIAVNDMRKAGQRSGLTNEVLNSLSIYSPVIEQDNATALERQGRAFAVGIETNDVKQAYGSSFGLTPGSQVITGFDPRNGVQVKSAIGAIKGGLTPIANTGQISNIINGSKYSIKDFNSKNEDVKRQITSDVSTLTDLFIRKGFRTAEAIDSFLISHSKEGGKNKPREIDIKAALQSMQDFQPPRPSTDERVQLGVEALQGRK